MGSVDAACLSGFLCRLCSELHRLVIHIYGDIGVQNDIATKINDYLPVTVSRTDPLPKTICNQCMERVEEHHQMMVTMARNSSKYLKHMDLLSRIDNVQPTAQSLGMVTADTPSHTSPETPPTLTEGVAGPEIGPESGRSDDSVSDVGENSVARMM